MRIAIQLLAWASLQLPALIVAPSGARGQSPEDTPPPPAAAGLERFLSREVEACASRTLEGVRDRADWEALRPRLRARVLETLGLSPPPPRGDLHATVTGSLDREDLGIIVEKLHFQPVPGLYATANLYRPRDVSGPLPTVLYLTGHGQVKLDGVSYGNKALYQHHPTWFARNGYVSLVVDTLQLGEIEGKHHGTYRLGQWWWVSRGYTPAGLEAWTAIRALDYLETRPEVDRARIGVTGRSGGGTYTWWLQALDDRPAVLAPVAGMVDLQSHVIGGAIDGHCDCNYGINLHRLDYPAIAAMAAPRPLLIINTDKDTIFPLAGVLRVHATARRVYELLGAADKLGVFIAEGPHADTQELQLAAFRWMNRWMKGDTGPVPMVAEKLIDPKLLKVFDQLPADELNTSIEERFVPAAPPPPIPTDAAAFEALRTRLLKALREGPLRNSPAPSADPKPRLITSTELEESTSRLYEVVSEGFPLSLAVTLPRGLQPSTSARLTIETELPRESAGAPAEACATLVPRGLGAARWSDDAKRENQIHRRFLAVGRTVEEAWIADVRQAIRALGTLPELQGVGITLAAAGDLATVAVYASLEEPVVTRLELTGLPASHRESIPLLGVQRVLDIPQAVALLLPRDVVLEAVDPQAFAWTREAALAGFGRDAAHLTIGARAPTQGN